MGGARRGDSERDNRIALPAQGEAYEGIAGRVLKHDVERSTHMGKKSGKRANGEGVLRERSDGRWEARVPTEIDPLTGKQKFKSFYGHTQTEAKAKRDEYLTAVRTGTYVEPKKVLFGDYMKKWLELFVQPKVKESTYSKYLFNMNNHVIPELGKIELQKIDVDTLQKFYNDKAKGLSTSVIAILHQLINGCLKHAVKKRDVLNNPAQLTERPRVRYKDVKPLTKEELQKFLDVAKNDPFYLMFLLDLHTGLRKGELLALRWQDVDLKAGVLHVERSLGRIAKPGEKGTKIVVSSTKTEAGVRDIPLPAEIITLLKSHKAAQNERKLALGQKSDATAEEPSPLAPKGLKVTVDAAGVKASWSVVSGAKDYIIYHDGIRLCNTNGATTWSFTASPGPHTITVSAVSSNDDEWDKCPEVKYTDGDYIFDNGYGKPIEARWLLRRLKVVLEKAELRQDIRMHTLRHTFGTMLAQDGENPRNLQELLGHADIRTTLGTYVHSTLEDKKRAVNRLASLMNG